MARPGLPKKYAKYGFKKGWRLYKASKRKRTSGTPRKKTTTTTVRKTTMAKPKRKYTKRRTTKAVTRKPRRYGRRMPKLLSQQTINTIIDGLLIGGGAIGSTVAANTVPFLKDQRALIKSLGQAGIGAVSLGMFKDKYIKKLSMGMIVGGAISAILPFLPSDLKVFGGRPFNASELSSLRVGKPFSLGRPVSVPAPSMAGGKSSYRSRGKGR